MKITELLNKVLENENSAFLFTPPYYNGEKCYFLTQPSKILTVKNNEEYQKVFREVEAIRKTHIVLAMLDYEAGYLFEEKFNTQLNSNAGKDLITLLCYNKAGCLVFDNSEIVYPEEDELNELGSYEISNFGFSTTYEEYINAIAKVKKYIYDGDTYQVNYTVKSKFNFSGNCAKLFLNLITNQSTRYSALINLNNKMIVSVSPELFFELDGNNAVTKPMKGTIERGINNYDDKRLKDILINSKKDKAENVMIVDLLRNDFGRIAEFNSVRVDSLFDIEKYESVFQMTSTIRARFADLGLGEIVKNIFPCGSITGAPKIRTMEIINELEKEPRGIYTGSIGVIEENSAKFNVAIRTLVIDKTTGNGEMGLGGGIVWDSIPDKEYNEVLVKGLFLTRQDKPFRIIETMLFENGDYFLLKEHLERLRCTAGFFLFRYDEEPIIDRLKTLVKELSENIKYKIRLLLNKEGTFSITSEILGNLPSKIKVTISNRRTSYKEKFLYFKTTNRDLYNEEYKSALTEGFFDAIFLNENGNFTEGAITNLFILKEGIWYTPLVSSGLLEGCYRNYFIQNHKTAEKDLTTANLVSAEKIVLVNSVRKEVYVEKIFSNGTIVWKQTN